MGANIAGIYGAQIFRQDDRPRYRRGFSINIAVLSVGLTLAVIRFVDDLFRRRRLAKELQEKSNEAVSQESGVGEPQPVLVGDIKTPAISSGLR